MLSLTVIICAYTLDRWADLQAAVSSIQQQTVPVEQIVVVVDHNDDLLERCLYFFADVLVIANSGPRGLSAGRNTGVAASTGDVVAFLDDDARAQEDWAANLLDAYGDESVVGVGGRVVPHWQAPAPIGSRKSSFGS